MSPPVLLDQSGNLKSALQRGEHKSLQTDRVILVPGADAEVATVNQIFQWLIHDDLAITAIANRLNAVPVLTDLDRPWTYSTDQSAEVRVLSAEAGNQRKHRRHLHSLSTQHSVLSTIRTCGSARKALLPG